MIRIKINKRLYKFVLVALAIFVSFGLVNVNAGYTYDSKGEPIYSTEGLTVNTLPYTYSSLGIQSTVTPSPADLFVYTLEDKENREFIPQKIYLTDAALDAVFVFDTEFNLEQTISVCRLVPNDLFSTNLTAIKSRVDDGGNDKSVALFPTSSQIPTQEELDDPTGIYEGKGYVELKLREPSAAYRATIPSTGEEFIYICDKGNNQVVVLDYNSYDDVTKTYKIHQVLTKPTDELDEKVAFAPKKIVTDIKGRMYVIADNVLDGIMQFSLEGQFQRYTGTNEITLNAWDIFWRNFSSETQLSNKSTLYNTTFNSMVYAESMIYTTSLAITNSDGTVNDKVMIKRINPSGDDTLARNGYKPPMGDVKYSISNAMNDKVTGSSQFSGITVNGYGLYSVVDSLRGRIFTYDSEGNLLYISGSKGVQADKLSNPVSIQYLGDDLLVLDANNKTIVKFEPTEIATLINKASKEEKIARRTRPEPKFNEASNSWWIDEVDTKINDKKAEVTEVDGYWHIGGKNTGIQAEALAAADYWAKVIQLNANYEFAYVGIGHKHLENENYKEAMKYFELGQNKIYYSKAYKQYRDGIIKQWFAPVITVVAVLLVGKFVYKKIKNKKLGIKKQEETGVGDE